MAIKTGEDDLIGSNGADILIALAKQGRERAELSGGAGNDALIAGHAPVSVDAGSGNRDRATAISLDDPALWSKAANPLIGEAFIPHTTIVGTGANEADWFSFTVDRACTITFDVDFADGGVGGASWDPWIAIWRGEQGLWNFTDGDPAAGGLGSVSGRDTYFSVDFRPGTYFIELFGFGAPIDRTVPDGASYVLNISATKHAVGAVTAVSGDDLDGGAGNDYLVGNGGEDMLAGGIGRDRLYAGGGDDRLLGGGGRDVLDGGAGADLLHGNAGADLLTGGAGADTFVLRRLPGAGKADTITDFAAGEDRIAIGGRFFDLPKGALDASAFHIGTAAADAGDRILYDADAGTLLFDADGNGAGAAVLFANVGTGLSLTAADFLVI
ncbi:calcium-binding protein [Sphingomonas sp.]|uniref:calcium-binding protein n=1 Tax=Sphingomonas sp. TaxID=28214 RepID=UPI0035C8746E